MPPFDVNRNNFGVTEGSEQLTEQPEQRVGLPHFNVNRDSADSTKGLGPIDQRRGRSPFRHYSNPSDRNEQCSTRQCHMGIVFNQQRSIHQYGESLHQQVARPVHSGSPDIDWRIT